MLKFQGQLTYARLLADVLARLIMERERALPDYLVPVPLHPARLRSRGFNQSAIIARHLARTLGLRCAPQAVIRVRETLPQMDLPARRRRTNVKGAFRVSALPSGRRVAVVDDVVTTGATAHEIGLVLQDGGVDEVELWCAARAV